MSRNRDDGRPLGPTDLKRLHRDWRRKSSHRLGLILDGVQQPFNAGGLIRSAAAYSADRVWMVPPTPPADHPKVAITAKGSERFLDIKVAATGAEAAAAAQADGFTVVAIELTGGASPLFDLALGPEVCLVLGHEERGIHRDTLALCDHVAYLPLTGKIGSLNVAHAGTAALAEVSRQHWQKS